MAVKILDTSKWQNSKVDFVAAKKAGYAGVILRVGCGNTKDKCFEKDYASAIAAGMLVGAYFYTYSTTEAQAIADATRVLGWLNNRHLDLPVAYDVEDAKQKGTNRKGINSTMHNAFSARIKAKGYDCMLYTGEYFFNNYFNKPMITDKLWIAKYSSKAPSVGRDVYMWQYTSGAISGDFYTEKLDRSYLYEDIATPTPTTPTSNLYAVPTKVLKRTFPMMKGNDVKWLQWELCQKGYFRASDIDGKFGDGTNRAVVIYQQTHGLKVDGKVGPATRYSMLND